MKLSKKQKQLKELWGKVGLIVNLSQMIEYTLANVLAFDEILREFEETDSMFVLEYNEFAAKANEWYNKLNNKPLGVGVRRAQEIKFFTEESEKELERILEERNYVIHKLFKEDLVTQELETNPTVYFERLETLIEDMYNANNDLNEIFRKRNVKCCLAATCNSGCRRCEISFAGKRVTTTA